MSLRDSYEGINPLNRRSENALKTIMNALSGLTQEEQRQVITRVQANASIGDGKAAKSAMDEFRARQLAPSTYDFKTFRKNHPNGW